MSSKLNADVELLLEQPFARVPLENYRKVFRTSQRHIDKDYGPIASSVDGLARAVSGDVTDVPNAATSLDGLIARVEGLKRKLGDLQNTAGEPTVSVLRQRIEHVNAPETMDSLQDFDAWSERRLDRWIVDWALRHGRTGTAHAIAETKHMETLVDIDIFAHVRRIEQALQSHSCSEALAWCSENKAALRKAKITLELDLRLQEYIELARSRKASEAIVYAKKHLTPWQETHLTQLTQAAALLAFPPTTTCAPYKRLYDLARWPTLVKSFRLAFFNLFMLPSEPILHLALFGGLAALKLPACNSGDCMDCPACTPPLSKLAARVPRAHRLNSTVVCAISGQVMDADNPPLAFPSGHVYSRGALEEMAAKHGGRVTCPRSGEEVGFSSLRKVFVS